MPLMPVIPMSVAGVVASIAVVTDLRSRRIPNILTGTALLVGLVGNLLFGGLQQGIEGALFGGIIASGGAILGFGLLLPLYVKRVGGAGRAVGPRDVKL